MGNNPKDMARSIDKWLARPKICTLLWPSQTPNLRSVLKRQENSRGNKTTLTLERLYKKRMVTHPWYEVVQSDLLIILLITNKMGFCKIVTAKRDKVIHCLGFFHTSVPDKYGRHCKCSVFFSLVTDYRLLWSLSYFNSLMQHVPCKWGSRNLWS